MLKSRKIRNIVAFAFAIVLCVSVVSIPAYASSLSQRFAAWVGAAITAANIALTPVGATAYQMYDYIADPIDYQYTYVDSALDDYFERSTIIVTPDSTTIDGVRYSDIWLSHDAADIFRTNAFDFKTAYNIASESNGTFASGVGTVNNVPVYNVDNVNRTQSFTTASDIGSYSNGLYNIRNEDYNTSTYRVWALNLDGSTIGTRTYNKSNPIYPPYTYAQFENNKWYVYGVTQFGPVNNWGSIKDSGIQYDEFPFSFDWVSGVIDMDPLDADDGLLIRVPSAPINPSTGSPYYDIPQLVTDNPVIDNDDHSVNIELDPTLNPNFQKDKDLLDDLGDLIRTILNVWDLLKDDGNTTIEYNKYVEPVPPEPEPPVPEPGTTIANTDYSVYDTLLRWIKHAIDNVKNAINNIATFIQNIDAMLQEIFDDIEEILEGLRDFFDPEWFNKLGDAIEKHAIDTFKKAIDKAKQIFLPIIGFIKLHLGIWHYVVEWLQSISTIFLWFFGIMSATAYNMVLPIYAVVAGVICIAIYKTFGR